MRFKHNVYFCVDVLMVLPNVLLWSIKSASSVYKFPLINHHNISIAIPNVSVCVYKKWNSKRKEI